MNNIVETISKYKDNGLQVGLICGCFDILHIGHIKLFQFAKKRTDKLIIGVDDDYSIKKTKGKKRPIHNQSIRLEILSTLKIIDHVFPINFNNKFGTEITDKFENLLLKLRPDILFTCILADKYADSKKMICDKLNIKFIPFLNKHNISTTIIEKIYLES